MIQIIATITFTASFLTLVVCALIPKPPASKLGKIYAHINDSESSDPTKPFDPFLALYTVEEISGNKARCKWRTIHLDGRTLTYDVWKSAGDVGMFDKEIKLR